MKMKNRKHVYSILVVVFLFSIFCGASCVHSKDARRNEEKAVDFFTPWNSSNNLTLLHSYSFTSDTLGGYPAEPTLSVVEPSACFVHIDDLSDSQGKHVALYKSGSGQRATLDDNLTGYGLSITAGELHCKVNHDSSLYGIQFIDKTGALFRLDFWTGNIGHYGSVTYTNYTYNQWFDVKFIFNLSVGWMFEINSVKFGAGYTYGFEHGVSGGIQAILFVSAFSGGGDGYFRVDDLEVYNALTSASFNSDPTGDEWPMFRGQLNHTGVATTTPMHGTALTWSFTTGNYVQSSPAITGGRVYVGSYNHDMYCLNATTSAIMWNFTTGGAIISSPTVAGGRVFVGSNDSKVYCFDAITGAQVWNCTTGGIVQSSPAVAGGRVYVGSYDRKVYCLNATTGARIWNCTTGDWVESAPAVVGERVYVGSNDYKIYCLNATTSARIWNYTTGGRVVSSPAVAGGRVFFGSEDFNVYCLEATTGAFVWSYTAGWGMHSSPAVVGGRVYIGTHDHNLYCLNASTGAKIWSYDMGFYVLSSPAVAGGLVYVGSNDNKVYCLNAITGELVWSYTTGNLVWSSPAIAGGRVYVGSWDGKVYCFPMILGIFTPSINHPSDITYSLGSTGNSISWTITATNTGTTGYTIYRNGTSIATGSWTSGIPVTITFYGLAAGIYNYTIVASNGLGGLVQDTVIVTVMSNNAPPPTGLGLGIIAAIVIIMACAAVIIVLVVVKVRKRRAVKSYPRQATTAKVEIKERKQREQQERRSLKEQQRREREERLQREHDTAEQQRRDREEQLQREHDATVHRCQDLVAEARAAVKQNEFERARSLVADYRVIASQANIADGNSTADALSSDIDNAEHEEKRRREELERLDKLRKIIKVSNSLEISRIAKTLEMDEEMLWKHIFDWAEQFGFRIEENKVIFGQGDTGAFIDELQRQFESWDEKTQRKDGKI